MQPEAYFYRPGEQPLSVFAAEAMFMIFLNYHLISVQQASQLYRTESDAFPKKTKALLKYIIVLVNIQYGKIFVKYCNHS